MNLSGDFSIKYPEQDIVNTGKVICTHRIIAAKDSNSRGGSSFG
jgi:hypothetical protein